MEQINEKSSEYLSKKRNTHAYARVHSIAVVGVHGVPVEVECQCSFSLPSFFIVGLPTASVREARERVQSALAAAGFALPSRKFTVNLSPAWLQKEGSGYDLAIAISCLVAAGTIPAERVQNLAFLGELSLDGQIKAVNSAYVLPELLRRKIYESAIVPYENSYFLEDEHLSKGGGFSCLRDLILALLGNPIAGKRMRKGEIEAHSATICTNLEQIRGQVEAKRMLAIAAAGKHPALLAGPRGVGKSFLSSAYYGILPAPSIAEAEEIAAIYAVKGMEWNQRIPLRSPHYSITMHALIGGGNRCLPGEITLAHGGLLFLDELLEMDRRILESLRLPLELGYLELARGTVQVRLPTRFYFLGAMNLCPCGLAGDPFRVCRCSQGAIDQYQRRLSSALLDRLDLYLEITPERDSQRNCKIDAPDSTACVKTFVESARMRMLERQKCPNGYLQNGEVFNVKNWSENAQKYLQRIAEQKHFSERGYISLARIALTISDLAGASSVQEEHVLEAAHYRKS